ncbi:hypothetical protein PITC_076150 [Penicillium italicum]|uniref:Uncharacterized protein n=1 Tax=Penicillium italicum TaxID=40296 RepID=A0A0A2KWJ5_PENIT|nr:hypothetical protein PITC_076150 [Penicillium italicum]
MPAPIETTDPLAVVRDLYDDEKLVVNDFERHASHCRNCSHAVQTYKDGLPLCESGKSHARDLRNYLYSQSGKYFSTVEFESGKSTRVKLPRDAFATRELLMALEQGMRIREKAVVIQKPVQPVKSATSTSYDRTYPVPARKVSGKQARPRSMSPEAYQVIERAPRLSRSPTSIMYRSPGGSPSRPSSSRGSLYSVDRQERVERQYETPRRQSGKYFSTVEFESGKSTRVKLPRDAFATRELLMALEQGMRIREKAVVIQKPVQPVKSATSTSYDRTYPVPARKVSGKQARPRSMSPEAYQVIERAPRLSRSPTSIMYRSPGGSPSRPSSSRGSLYSVDRQERVERQYETPRRYVEGSPKHR